MPDIPNFKIEHVARALFVHNFKGWRPVGDREVAWENAPEGTRAAYRRLALAGIRAADAWDLSEPALAKLLQGLYRSGETA